MSKLGSIFKPQDIFPPNFNFDPSFFKKNVEDSYLDWITEYPTPFRFDFRKFTFINNLSICFFPKEFHFEVNELKKFIKSWCLLSKPIDEKLLGERFGVPAIIKPTLYDLITHYDKYPANKYISSKSINILLEIENCHKLGSLGRFFENKGRVFDSTLFVTYPGDIKQFSNPLEEYYILLEQDEVLRKATEKDTPLILNFLTKKQILIALKESFQKSKEYPIEKLEKCLKREIIETIQGDSDIKSLKIHNHFYLLNKNYQELKGWIEKEITYYRIIKLLNEEPDDWQYLTIAPLMKELIIRNKDYDTANKLGTIFYKIIINQDLDDFFVQLEISKVEIQMKKIIKQGKA